MALKKDHRVIHFTSTFRHTSKKQRFSESSTLEESPGYTVEYVRSQGYKKNISLERVAAHTDFAERLIESFDGRQRPDVIFISMPPLSSAERVVKWGKANDVPVITDIIDPWPDSFIKDVPSYLKPVSRLFIRPFYSKLRTILENSTAVTSISNGYLKWAHMNCKAIQRTACFYPALDLQSIQESIQKYRKEGQRNDEVRLDFDPENPRQSGIQIWMDPAKREKAMKVAVDMFQDRRLDALKLDERQKSEVLRIEAETRKKVKEITAARRESGATPEDITKQVDTARKDTEAELQRTMTEQQYEEYKKSAAEGALMPGTVEELGGMIPPGMIPGFGGGQGGGQGR
jgi:hypothetical protein